MTRANKQYECEYCGLPIDKGSDYFKVHGFDEDHELFDLKAHHECEDFMEAIGELDDGYSYEPMEDFDNAVESWIVDIDYDKFYKEHPNKNFGSDHKRTLRYLVGKYDRYAKGRTDFEDFSFSPEDWKQIREAMKALQEMIAAKLKVT